MALKSYNNFANEISYFAQFTTPELNEVKYFLQETDLPSIITGITTVIKNGETLYLPGDSKDKTALSSTYIIDEDFEVYLSFLEMQEQYRKTLETLTEFEIYLQNNQNVNILKFTFNGVFFSSVTPPRMSTTGNETSIVLDVEMNYSNYSYKRLN